MKIKLAIDDGIIRVLGEDYSSILQMKSVN